MKTVCIGDIHGRPIWKTIVKKEQPDRVIFQGDYFDSPFYTVLEQIRNFKDIIQYKLSSDIEVILLVGNHDAHYLSLWDQPYSGYSYGGAVAIQQVLEENLEHLQMAYQFDDFLFTHAGVSPVFMKNAGYKNDMSISMFLNLMWKYKPQIFRFTGWEKYGENITQTPIWIRPKSLMKACRKSYRKKYIQIVGHTAQNEIDIKGKSTGGRYYFIDTLGTNHEYLIINNNLITSNKITEDDYRS